MAPVAQVSGFRARLALTVVTLIVLIVAANFVAEEIAAALDFEILPRYLALAVALNLPGNFLIGGGGGIALIAGVSKLYSITGFMLTVAIAVAPVPLAVHLLGTDFLFG